MNLALVVLAAGASSRLGTCKALVDLGGAPPLARLLAAAHGAGFSAELVVGGAHAAALQEWLAEWLAAPPAGSGQRPSRSFVVNTAWSAGRLGGIARAAERVPGADLCLAPVDVPLVSAATFETLAATWHASGAPPRGWLAPRHAGRYGHPVVLGQHLAAEALHLPPDTPLRALRAAAEPCLAVDVPDAGVLDDLDTPADLERLRHKLSERP